MLTGMVALLTLLVAAFGGWIAYQQMRINRTKLKVDRFDKRFEVYETTMDFVNDVLATQGTSGTNLDGFLQAVRKSQFLLGDDIHEYLLEIASTATSIEKFSKEINASSADAFFGVSKMRKEDALEKRDNAIDWLGEHHAYHISGMFHPYLSVEDINGLRPTILKNPLARIPLGTHMRNFRKRILGKR
ncbi:hypothetical protein AWB76_00931 [Caballeronia temeraria]|uniref:Uncharacterized protein n=1 Tax=Caballeronia temeraria TaxID=1777137 RepID=A0A157ZM22_9BURK|nr:hypothetical protein [Caballeronia temeraria]SAK46531.1 hypothetical protein AWB76_00931 [Caballeronia temeraria]